MPGDTASSWSEAMDNLARVLRAGRSGVVRDLDRVGLRLVSELKVDLSKPGKGRLYTTYFYMGMTPAGPKLFAVGKRDKPHRASKAGDPPAVDEGELRASYGHEAYAVPGGGELVIASGAPYAPYLEFGTSRMKPRPHVRPLMARNKGVIRDAVADGIGRRERLMAARIKKGG